MFTLSETRLKAGDLAPEWSGAAIGEDGERELSSASLRGEAYVLYFYPKDNTPGCTTQACDFRDQSLAGLGYRVIGCSPDSIRSHQNFQTKHSFGFDLVSDPEHTVAEAFGVWREKKNYGRVYMGIVRSTFVVDAEGVITHAFDNVRAKGHVERLRKALESGA